MNTLTRKIHIANTLTDEIMTEISVWQPFTKDQDWLMMLVARHRNTKKGYWDNLKIYRESKSRIESGEISFRDVVFFMVLEGIREDKRDV